MRRSLVVVCALALALTGCRLDTTVDITVAPDGSGAVRVELVADAELTAAAPGLADDLRLDDLRAAGWTVVGPTSRDGGLTMTLTHDFADVDEANALLASLTGAGGPIDGLRLTRVVDGDATTVRLAGTVGLGSDLSGFVDAEALEALGAAPYAAQLAERGQRVGDAAGLTVEASLPGSTEANGLGGAATWTAPADGTTATISATAVARHGGGAWGTVRTLVVVVLVAWIALVLAFAAYVAARRRAGPALPDHP